MIQPLTSSYDVRELERTELERQMTVLKSLLRLHADGLREEDVLLAALEEYTVPSAQPRTALLTPPLEPALPSTASALPSRFRSSRPVRVATHPQFFRPLQQLQRFPSHFRQRQRALPLPHLRGRAGRAPQPPA